MKSFKFEKCNFGSWDSNEFSILNNHYPSGGALECRRNGLNRSYRAIRSKANAIGIEKISFRDICRDFGIADTLVTARMNKGMSLWQALTKPVNRRKRKAGRHSAAMRRAA